MYRDVDFEDPESVVILYLEHGKVALTKRRIFVVVTGRCHEFGILNEVYSV